MYRQDSQFKFSGARSRVTVMAALVVFAFVGAIAFMLLTTVGQGFITLRVLSLINAPGSSMSIGVIEGQWPAEILLRDVTVKDRDGVWLDIDRVALHWHPTQLLHGRIAVESLEIGQAAMLRRPLGNANTAPVAPFDLQGLVSDLRRVTIAKLALEKLSLAEPVLGKPVTLQAAGSLQSVADNLTLALDVQRNDLPGTARIRLNGAPSGVALDLDAATVGFTLKGNVAIAKADAALSGAIRFAHDGAPLTGEVDFTFGGTRADPTVAADFSARDMMADGRPISRVAGMLQSVKRRDGVYALTGSGTISDLRAFAPEAAVLLRSEGRWSLAATQTEAAATLESFVIDAGDATFKASGVFARGELKPATLTVTARGLGRLAGWGADKSLTTIAVNAEHFADTGMGNGGIDVAVTGLIAGGLPRDFLATAKWTAGAEALHVTNLAGLAPGIVLSGESTWPRSGDLLDHGTTTAALTIAATQVGVEKGEPLRVTLKLEGLLAQLQGNLSATAVQVGAGDNALRDLAATLKAGRQGKTITAALDLHGTWKNAPLVLSAAAAKDAGPVLRITPIKAESIAGRIDGGFDIDTGSGLASGALNANLADVHDLAAAFGIDARGSLDAAANFAVVNGKQRAALDVAVNALASNPLSSSRLTLNARVDNGWGVPRFDGTLKATTGTLLGRGISALSAHAAGTAADFTASLDANGGDLFKLGIDAHVTGGAQKLVTFTRLAVQDSAVKGALTAPAAVTISDSSISAERIQIAVDEGTLNGDFSLDRASGAVRGTATAKNISLAPFVPPGLGAPAGVADGALTIGGKVTEATVNASVTAHFAAERRSGTPAFTVAATLRGENGRLAVTANAEGFSPAPASVTADIPFQLDLTGPRVIVAADGPIKGTATWNGSIAPLWALLPLDDHILAGTVMLDLAVAGTFSAPQIQGQLHLKDGRYENIPGGTVLRNLDLDLSTERGDDLVLAMTARDTRNGTASVAGRLVRGENGSWSADLAGELQQLQVLARDDASGAVSGKITYKGPLASGLLKGDLAVARGAINLDATGVPEVPLLRSYAITKAEGDTDVVVRPPSPITFDISLSMADPLRVEGRGLLSAWRGQLYISSSIAAPNVVGSVSSERGTFTFLGQSFDLESGTVTFTGGGRIDPTLNIVAVREVTGITVTVNITGRANAPTIVLSSRPALPQDEVLARLMFNRSAGELGPLESLQLASAAADMSGLARGGISGMVRRTFGLDTFSFGGQSGNAVVVGRQLGRNVFLSIEQSVNSTSRVFVLSWRLTSHFSLRSSASDQTGADLGVFWRKDY